MPEHLCVARNAAGLHQLPSTDQTPLPTLERKSIDL